MNIQQLEYIVAVDQHRHFARAAKHCGVSQPTLSMMIQKLEDEIGVEIFDRSRTPVGVNKIGEMIITQARVVLYNIKQFREIADSSRESLQGDLEMSIIPTVAPYLLLKLFGEFRRRLPSLRCKVSEMKTSVIIEKLKSAEIELAIVATPLSDPDILEVPLYYERFLAYISPSDELYSKEFINASELDFSRMWILEEGHCFRDQAIAVCKLPPRPTGEIMEGSSLSTLVQMVGAGIGVTLIPEMAAEVELRSAPVVLHQLPEPRPKRTIGLVWRRSNPLADRYAGLAEGLRVAFA